jgi:hypothetical protein
MLALANGFIAGELNLIAVARKLHGFCDGVEPQIGALLDVFVAITSETDALPVNEERAFWSAEALARKDKEIGLVEQRWHDKAIAAATRLARLLEREDDGGG